MPASNADYAALQQAIQKTRNARAADQETCEAFLNALYHAARHANGPGKPLNNVTLNAAPDPFARVRPVPVGGTHAAWLKLGLYEVLVRVRRDGPSYIGEYGQRGTFLLTRPGETELLDLARAIIADGADLYGLPENDGVLN
ncbi:hypothetical protein [Deinococcus maricopensis]|uniref:Uncharacterized protein n=1 Tax=Deinococcus maricopensis (strain DSM 21211 / LMG 22137 / NRRL B-23946 / LB-34) TaxID=709986 RepID=E8UAA9_DEIML|nr:hypothetical protein [Deinococcus maricopensis]ADV67998.1 hypothetical protein Deima_2360 [Deinococcus maricopensis DSM 21211]